jgi:tyrosinase
MVALSLLALGALFTQALAAPTATESAIVTPTVASTSTPVAENQLDSLAGFAYDNILEAVEGDSDLEKRSSCSLRNLRIRRDWRTFSKTQKKSYISSLLCLQKLPSLTPSEQAPGARSRYDDFVATHINQTTTIHYTGTFLAWHRYYIYTFEEALRNECGYTGDYP